MSKDKRVALIQRIEAHRKSKVISFFWADRQGLETRIANDSLSLAAQLLERIGNVPVLDLFLYSTGGITMAAFALVNLIRQFAERFSVLIPYKAQSAATLICLGADEIVMTPLATLSPVDPSTNSPFNPLVPNQPEGTFPPQTLPVSVEDVASYIDLAKVEAGLTRRSHLKDVFLKLAEDVRPLALGSVHRARTQIKMLSRKLLASRSTGMAARDIKRIVDVLTKELFSHDYTIGRREARDEMRLHISYPESELEALIMQLYREYEADLSLLSPYQPETVLKGKGSGTFTFERGYMETIDTTFGFVTERELKRVQVTAPGPGGVQIPTVAFSERTLSEGWRTL